jgi:hypothetical protein
MRAAAMLISPYVPRGSVFQRPQGKGATSEFEHSSISSTLKTLFNLTTYLTSRDEWAGSFDELLLETPRSDASMPLHLPRAPTPAKPWGPVPPTHRGRQTSATKLRRLARREHADRAARDPSVERHCSSTEGTCHASAEHPTVKQRRDVQLLSTLTGGPQLSHSQMLHMGKTRVDMWLKRHWDIWMNM